MRGRAARLKITLIICGIVFLFMGVRDIYYNSKTPADFNSLLESDIQKGMIIEGDLYGNLGYFEENYTTRNGVKTGSSKYNYMIPVGETQYMGLLNHTTTLENELNVQTDETYAYMMGETTTEPSPVHFKGRVIKMDDETKGYFREYMIYLGFTEQEVESYILPYYIKCENYESGGIFALIGFVCLLIGVLIVVGPFIVAHKKQGAAYVNSNPSYNINNTNYGGTVIEDDFDSFLTTTDNNYYNNVNDTQYNDINQETVIKEDNSPFQSAFGDLNMNSSTTSTTGLGMGVADEYAASEEKKEFGFSLKLKD